MTEETQWVDAGSEQALRSKPVTAVRVAATNLAITFREGAFGAISGACNHAGGPLGEGSLEGDYVVCPWHYWKFHATTGLGEPGYEADRVPAYAVKVEGGRVLVDLKSATRRNKAKHAPHPLSREVVRAPGPIRVVGVSTTAMDPAHPRYSTSDVLLTTALEHAKAIGCETQKIDLWKLGFRNCEGFYSKAARACTWPCSITQMDKTDQMEVVYEAFVHWADAIVVATPIRWGNASSLYYKMAERMNCVQNQETIANRHLMQKKTAAFIITGGQDNVQAVAGQLLGFFSELGCHLPPFPFIAHSRGWSAEDMQNNVRSVKNSDSLRDGARALIDRTVSLSRLIVEGAMPASQLARGGRKAHALEPFEEAPVTGDAKG
ncbi:MAG: NAD(P)H-dependent oxidoreductase [Archangium sp.]|nr:NAD(P)H-dependent oxidoreductase [Archangium sp.]MDP3154674.1 NAD(P)H-dependent oxidoreductase [Archangium sp.]MDP3572698.1 NAD(P)H-dependent oxidoreductase [Archangium sp.]